MISIIQLGTVDYSTGLRLQQQLVALRKEGKIGDVLLLLEHTPVITLGRNAKAANVVASRELLAQRGVELFECDRGGGVTFHGPGQIVGYPIFDLRRVAAGAQACPEPRVGAEAFLRPGESQTRPSLRKTLGVVEFVRRLEDVLIRTCADFSIPAKRIPGLTGVWTDDVVSKGCDFTRAAKAPDEGRALAAEVERDSNISTLSSRAEQEDSPANLPAESGNLLSSASETQAHAEAKLAAIGAAHVGTGAPARLVERSSTATPVPEAKLAAIGVHVSRFVTSHGFALNVNTDLSYFELIVPCGITSMPVTSMQRELGHPLDLSAVAESISCNFAVVFQSQILWLDTLDALLGRTVGVPMKPPAELRQLHKEDDTTWA